MSIIFDAKEQALAAHPNNRDAAVDLFVGYVGADRSDIEYEIGMTCEEYIFGNVEDQP